MKFNGIWITWEVQRRNYGISSAIDFPLYVIRYKGNRLLRYLLSLSRTLTIIVKKRPTCVIAQNPSIVLSIFTVIISKFLRFRAVIDAHNGGLYPLEGRVKLLMQLSVWLQRNANLTIVTNEELKKVVEENGGSAFILPDAIPQPASVNAKVQLLGQKNIVSICTYGDDEPYMAVIEAARHLPANVYVYITGNFKNRSFDVPSNVILTGFLPDAKYWELLSSADVLMDLTLRENCLVCGAYEAVALEKPLVLSNTKALRQYFCKGCVYTDADALDISEKVLTAIDNADKMQNEMQLFKSELKKRWQVRALLLQETLSVLK